MSSVNRATLADQAYQELRARMLSGQLPAGRRLMPEELAAELAISPTPIKEALVRLEADGLVVSPQRKGAMVRQFTARDVQELYEVRLLIELDALAKGFRLGRITSDLIASLRHTLSQHKFHARRDTFDDQMTALGFDREFHQQLVLAAGNTLVVEWHLRILSQTHRAFVYTMGEHNRSAEEHRQVVDALAGGSADIAIAALEQHLTRSRDATLLNVVRADRERTES